MRATRSVQSLPPLAQPLLERPEQMKHRPLWAARKKDPSAKKALGRLGIRRAGCVHLNLTHRGRTSIAVRAERKYA